LIRKLSLDVVIYLTQQA